MSYYNKTVNKRNAQIHTAIMNSLSMACISRTMDHLFGCKYATNGERYSFRNNRYWILAAGAALKLMQMEKCAFQTILSIPPGDSVQEILMWGGYLMVILSARDSISLPDNYLMNRMQMITRTKIIIFRDVIRYAQEIMGSKITQYMEYSELIPIYEEYEILEKLKDRELVRQIFSQDPPDVKLSTSTINPTDFTGYYTSNSTAWITERGNTWETESHDLWCATINHDEPYDSVEGIHVECVPQPRIQITLDQLQDIERIFLNINEPSSDTAVSDMLTTLSRAMMITTVRPALAAKRVFNESGDSLYEKRFISRVILSLYSDIEWTDELLDASILKEFHPIETNMTVATWHWSHAGVNKRIPKNRPFMNKIILECVDHFKKHPFSQDILHKRKVVGQNSFVRTNLVVYAYWKKFPEFIAHFYGSYREKMITDIMDMYFSVSPDNINMEYTWNYVNKAKSMMLDELRMIQFLAYTSTPFQYFQYLSPPEKKARLTDTLQRSSLSRNIREHIYTYIRGPKSGLGKTRATWRLEETQKEFISCRNLTYLPPPPLVLPYAHDLE
mgnify:CR=1 FL=1